MIQGDTFQALQKPINKIQTILHDPFLSEFKYHFIIRKLPIFHIVHDKFRWNQFIMNLYKGFNAHFMGHNSIHIVQLLNVYPQHGIVDLIVGFRRDQHALKFIREIHTFEFQNCQFQIEVAQGFKTYLDELNQKYRLQAAQRQKIRAQQSQLLRLAQAENQQKLKNSPIFIRQMSNPISVYKEKSQKSVPQLNPQQGQIIDNSYKGSTRRKNPSIMRSQSESSVSLSSKKQKIKKSNQKQNSSPQSRSDHFNRHKAPNSQKNYRKKNSSRSSSSSYSAKSRDSYQRSRKNISYRDSRSRDNKYSRNISSHSDSSSRSKSSEHSKLRKNNYKESDGYAQRKRPRDQKDSKYDIQKRYEQNRRYEIYAPPSYNRSYSSNYNDRFKETPELQKKLSYQSYNAYRGPANPNNQHRYEPQYYEYQKQNPSHNYNYYKNVPGYPFPKPQVQLQKKQSFNSSNQSNAPKSSNPNPQFRYGNKNTYYTKNQGYNQ